MENSKGGLALLGVFKTAALHHLRRCKNNIWLLLMYG